MEPQKWSSYGAKRAKSLSFPIPVSKSSIFPSTLGTQSMDRSLQTAGLLRKEGKHNSSQQRDLALLKPECRVGKLDCWEVFRGKQAATSRFPGRAALAAAKGPRSSLPCDFVPVAAGWVPCNISRGALTGSRGEGNRASLAHLAFPPTPGGV